MADALGSHAEPPADPDLVGDEAESDDGRTAYERWELPNVGEQAEGEQFGTGGRPMTASQLQALQDQAYEEAYARGHGEGHAAGLEAGMAQGRAKAEHDLAPAIAAVNAALGQLARPFEAMDDEIESSMVTLCCTIARQLFLGTLDEEPKRVLDMIHAGLKVLPSAERRVTLELNPQDVSLVRESMPEAVDWLLQADPDITRGGCRISTDVSSVDVTVESRLETVLADVYGIPAMDPSRSRKLGTRETEQVHLGGDLETVPDAEGDPASPLGDSSA